MRYFYCLVDDFTFASLNVCTERNTRVTISIDSIKSHVDESIAMQAAR